MRRRFQWRYNFICALVLALPLHAQWTQTNGPFKGGAAYSFAVTGSNVYAATTGGVFVSSDTGKSWKVKNIGLENKDLTDINAIAILVNGSEIYTGTNSGVFRSTDGGDHWTPFMTNTSVAYVRSLAASGTNLFAGTNSKGILRATTDNGSWTAVNNGINDRCIHALAVCENRLYAGTDTSGIYSSSDNGESWTALNAGLTCKRINTLTVVGPDLYAATDSGVFHLASPEAGWKALNQGLPLNPIGLILGGSPTDLLAGVPWQGFFHSSDKGETWQAIDDSLINAQYFSALAAIGSRFIAGTGNGPFYSDNRGAQWQPSSSGFLMLSINALTAIDSNLYAATAHDGIFLSKDFGETWRPINNGLKKLEIYCFAVSDSDFYAGSYSNSLYHSTDKGANWEDLNINAGGADVLTLAAKGSVIAAGSYTGTIYRSADKGYTWTKIKLDSPTNIYSLAFSGDALLAGTRQVFRSIDVGATWSASGTGLPQPKAFTSFAVADDALYVGISPYGGVGRSTDNGLSWTLANNGLPSEAFIWSLAATGKGIFALDNSKGVFLSMDHGASWKAVGSELTTAGITTLLPLGGYLFAGAQGHPGGIWRRPLSEMLTAVEPPSIDIPSEFSLGQNYPNPFNPSSTITYAIPSAEVVSLKVYDILGREVATLVNEHQARGQHTVTFDASRLSGGMYVYRIHAGHYAAAKKMQLVK